MVLAFLSREFLCEDHKSRKSRRWKSGEEILLRSKHCRAERRPFEKHRAQNSLPRCKMRDYDGMKPTNHCFDYMKSSGTTLPIRSRKLQHLSTCTLVFSDGYYRAECL